jgi:glucoamylase
MEGDKMNRYLQSTLTASALMSVLLSVSAFAITPATGSAPGGPGATSNWANARKSFLGTSTTGTSSVYFTGYRNIVTEVYYPTLDNPNNVDLQFLVGDSANTFVDEEKVQAGYTATQPDKRSMDWTVGTSNAAHNWQISKVIFTDPTRNALIQQVTFTALNGKNVSNFNLYLLYNSSTNDSGENDNGTTVVSGGRTMLVASKSTTASAIGVSLPWTVVNGTTMASVGYVGVNDGWTDLLGGSSPDYTMNDAYNSALSGNVAHMGWVSFGGSTATSITFNVVLGFGATPTAAMNTANATLGDNITTLKSSYDNGWHSYTNGLSTQGGTADNQYYLSAMTLKTMQDKSNGAIIAGIGSPWGENANDTSDTGGYHLVWARDLFKFSNALITAGDTASPTAAVNFLFNVQQNASTGRFPQNSQINGTPYWNATQMDEQAMPILLAYRLGPTVYNPLWPKIRLAANYIAANGPWTQEERWEEDSGYSPSTIAAEIAGLVAAGQIAIANGDNADAATYFRLADYWQQNVTGWTYTTNGPLSSNGYYIRLNPSAQGNSGSGPQIYNPTNGPNVGTMFTIGNGGGTHDQRNIIDGGFLELVRMGVKSPNDSSITSTLPVYDSAVMQTISGAGNAWFRYNFDGYGETNAGADYNGTSGRGRLWPIFTAERGQYAIAQSGSGSSGSAYLATVKALSTPEGFVPEQVWSNNATVTPGVDGGWQVTTPSPFVIGTATGSMAPLNWAMGEYINLLAAIYTQKVNDTSPAVCSRYNNCTVAPVSGQAQAVVNVTANTSMGQWMYVTGNVAALGSWNTDLGTPVDPTTYPVWKNKINLPASSSISYKYYRKNSDGSVTWENISGNGNRTLNTPASGTVTVNDTVAW